MLKTALSFLFFCVSWADQAELYEFLGHHYVASFKLCDEKALEDFRTLKTVFLEATIASGASVLDYKDYVFNPNGLTMVVLLSESHASIHTYPEHRACFVDLFTCGCKCKWENFEAYLKSYLKPESIQYSIMKRGDIK